MAVAEAGSTTTSRHKVPGVKAEFLSLTQALLWLTLVLQQDYCSRLQLKLNLYVGCITCQRQPLFITRIAVDEHFIVRNVIDVDSCHHPASFWYQLLRHRSI